jgi:hypothetical protein
MTEEINPNTQTDTIDDIIAYARSLPDFPNKALILQRLETRNLNRYQEAALTINEVLAMPNSPDAPAAGGKAVTADQLQSLIDRISRLEATDIIAE